MLVVALFALGCSGRKHPIVRVFLTQVHWRVYDLGLFAIDIG